MLHLAVLLCLLSLGLDLGVFVSFDITALYDNRAWVIMCWVLALIPLFPQDHAIYCLTIVTNKA